MPQETRTEMPDWRGSPARIGAGHFCFMLRHSVSYSQADVSDLLHQMLWTGQGSQPSGCIGIADAMCNAWDAPSLLVGTLAGGERTKTRYCRPSAAVRSSETWPGCIRDEHVGSRPWQVAARKV